MKSYITYRKVPNLARVIEFDNFEEYDEWMATRKTKGTDYVFDPKEFNYRNHYITVCEDGCVCKHDKELIHNNFDLGSF